MCIAVFASMYVCALLTYLVPSEVGSKCQILWNWDSVTESCEQLGIQPGPSGSIDSASSTPHFFKQDKISLC